MSVGNIYGYTGGNYDRTKGDRAAAAGVLISILAHLLAAASLMLLWSTAGNVRHSDLLVVSLTPPEPVRASGPELAGIQEASAASPQVSRPPLPAPANTKDIQEASHDEPEPRPVHREIAPLREAVEAHTRIGEGKPDSFDISVPAGVTAGGEEVDTEQVTINAPATAQAPAPGQCCGTESELLRLREEYAVRLKELIERFVDYPLYARRARLEGTCMLICRINPEGEVLNVGVASSTGHDMLDRAAVNAVRKAGDFPPVPYKEDEAELEVSVPVSFSLDGR